MELKNVLSTINSPIFERPKRVFRAFYRIFIEPKSVGEDSRRREFIFNIIATALFGVICLLELSVLYADMTGITKGGFNVFSFSIFILFFGSLILLSRKGHVEIATYLFLGLYFLASTWGEYAWGIAVPLALLSYGAIIVMTSILLGTRAGFIAAGIIMSTLISLGYLETHGIIESDITWRFTQLEFKDTIENSFIYGIIVIVSWLSNREIERSLARARRSERELKLERDLLEVKVEERTKELKTAEFEKVSQLYKFVEFGRLASGIFHDLLNPLSVVALSIEKLNEEKTDVTNGDAKEYIERAIKASKRMETFMQTARKQLDSVDRHHLFSINREIEDAIDLLLHKSRKSGTQILFTAEKDITIYGNSVKLFQIAVNLISNAIDSYETISDSREKIILVQLLKHDTEIELKIIDKGSGIEDAIVKTIFEPFFTTKNTDKRKDSGLGLGLSTTKEHVEKDFGGRITLETTVNKGTTFIVHIPIKNNDALYNELNTKSS